MQSSQAAPKTPASRIPARSAAPTPFTSYHEQSDSPFSFPLSQSLRRQPKAVYDFDSLYMSARKSSNQALAQTPKTNRIFRHEYNTPGQNTKFAGAVKDSHSPYSAGEKPFVFVKSCEVFSSPFDKPVCLKSSPYARMPLVEPQRLSDLYESEDANLTYGSESWNNGIWPAWRGPQPVAESAEKDYFNARFDNRFGGY